MTSSAKKSSHCSTDWVCSAPDAAAAWRSHWIKPGCSVRAALEAGTLDPERLHNFDKMQRELRLLAKRQEWAKMKKHQPRPPGSDSDTDE